MVISGTQGPIYRGWVPKKWLLCGFLGTHICQDSTRNFAGGLYEIYVWIVDRLL